MAELSVWNTCFEKLPIY